MMKETSIGCFQSFNPPAETSFSSAQILEAQKAMIQ